MLAYVFWHRPGAATAVDEYERALVAFHAALADSPPSGFERSFSHRFERLPWLGEGGPGYEDWYLARDWTAVGALESGAVSGDRRAPHDRTAVASAEGAGAVFGLVAGSGSGLAGSARTWFYKPAGIGYRELDDLLAPSLASDGIGLWRRRLVLGPAPENCLAGAPAAGLPAEVETHEASGALIFRR